ncbi:MAG: hypothetical protein KAS36_03490 [Anaerolineales bacterium]|nr:hypothetical protein [Anaerolineales bacterium]
MRTSPGSCFTCRATSLKLHTALERREYAISGMCGACQRSFFDIPIVDKGAAVVNIQRIYRGWRARQDLELYLTCPLD